LQEVLLEQKWNVERIALNQGGDLNIINRDQLDIVAMSPLM
jgi:hypothetical protein